jgi:hypothetical protein
VEAAHAVGPEDEVEQVRPRRRGELERAQAARRVVHHLAEQAREGRVHHDEVPVPVEGDRAARLVLAQDELDGTQHVAHARIVEPRLLETRGEPRRFKEDVPLAQRHVEHVGELQQHGAARRRPPGLDEADVPRRHVGLEPERELAQVTRLPPASEQRPDAGRRRHGAVRYHAGAGSEN